MTRLFPRAIPVIAPLLFAMLGAGCGSSSVVADVVADDSAADMVTVTDAVTMPDAAVRTDAGPVTDDGGRTYQVRYPLQARFPEGGTYDPSTHAFYVGSLADGTVHRIDAATGTDEVIFTETAPGRWWTLGMTVDVARRRLWVCAMDNRNPPPRAGFVWIFDLNTNTRVANHALSAAAADATCTDVALTRDGRGYVTDRELPNVYRVDETTGPTLFATDPALRSDVVGQNAIVVLPDESALMSVVYIPPRIARIDLADRSVRVVAVDGPFFDGAAFAGADGMTYADGSLYVALTSKLVRITPTGADWSRANATAVNVPEGMTDVVATPVGVYLLNGQAVRYAFGRPTDPFELVRFVGAL